MLNLLAIMNIHAKIPKTGGRDEIEPSQFFKQTFASNIDSYTKVYYSDHVPSRHESLDTIIRMSNPMYFSQPNSRLAIIDSVCDPKRLNSTLNTQSSLNTNLS